jgi:alcohol dehydrogenase class IV
VTIDALNHVVEAATTIVASPFSISLAKDTIELIAKYLPITVKDPANLVARYFLVYASMIAGISFDNGFLHLTHALEHPMSGVKPELAHGLGLAMLLPSVVKTIYPAESEVLADILEPITGKLKGTPDEAEFASVKVKEWLKKAGINTTLKDVGFKAEDVDKLTNLAFETPSLSSLLSLSPVKATKEVVRDIYIESL